MLLSATGQVHAKNKEKKSQAKSFSRGIERPAREYDDVDPTFEVSRQAGFFVRIDNNNSTLCGETAALEAEVLA